jgi:hypothetical protein
VLYRLTRLHFPDAAYFGRGAMFRFHAPDRSFGVCYLGTSLDCCLLEVVSPTYRPTAAPLLIIIQSQADHRNHDVHDAGYRNCHRACLGWARSVALTPSIFILSAKYSLVRLDQVIEPV